MTDSWEEEDTHLAAVEAALDRLRRQAESGATRAAVVNLVVLAAADDGARRAVESVVGLGAHHPGRIIVVVPRQDDHHTLSARAELHCSQVDGRSLWWDVVWLEAGRRAVAHAESLVDPLLIHDLHVAVWLAGGTSRVDSPALLELADQVIVSGERAALAAPAGVAADLGSLASRRTVSDLAWLATEPGRQALARLFDGPDERDRLASASGLSVGGPPWSSRLLAAWLCERLELDPGTVRLSRSDDLTAELALDGGSAVLDAGPVWPAGHATAAGGGQSGTAAGGGPEDGAAGGEPEDSAAGGEPEDSAVPGSGPGAAVATLGERRVTVPHGGSGTAQLLAAALSRPVRDARYEAALSRAGMLPA